jgi:hypothetical protein
MWAPITSSFTTGTRANGNWTGETPLDGLSTEVSVAANQDGRLEVFYLDLESGGGDDGPPGDGDLDGDDDDDGGDGGGDGGGGVDEIPAPGRPAPAKPATGKK